MKKIIRLLTLALLTVPVTTFAQSEGNQNTSEPAGKVVASKPDSLLDWETPHDPTCPQVLLETSMGNILVALYNDTPKHRDNFLKLVNSGYYDGCGYGPYGYSPWGYGMYPWGMGRGIMPGGYGMGVPGANVLGAGVRYTNSKKTFSIGLNVEGVWYDNKTPAYFKQYDYPVPKAPEKD